MQVQINSREERNQRFRSLLEEFCAMAKTEGFEIVPYRGSGPAFFMDMPEALQIGTLRNFEAYVDVAREVRDQGGSLQNDQLFLWRMFQKMKVHPPSDLMAEIRDGEVIEIHNGDFVQIYRNLHFFSLCSYTLDDLLCRPFWQLFARDEGITNQLIEIAGAVFSGKTLQTQHVDVSEHAVLEIDSPGRFLSVIQHRFAAPLYSAEGTPVGVVAGIRIISNKRTAEAPEPASEGDNSNDY